MTLVDRQRIFGPLQYIRRPVPGNPENIEITGSWVKDNIVIVDLPKIGKVQFHRKASDAIQFWFAQMEQMDLLKYILTFDGTFCPRLIRGSTTILSNHAFGTAIDLNAKWNGLGQEPAALGTKGSVLEFVEVAKFHKFGWGGDYQKRKDPMHFEYRGEE